MQKKLLERGDRIMDAVKFLEEAGRMCKSVERCQECPLGAHMLDITECRMNS